MDLTAANYVAMFRALLPPGLAWPGFGRQGQIIQAWADEYALIDGRIRDLLRESFPARTVEMLPDWEAEFGLPEPCEVEVALTDDQRRLRLAAKAHYLADHAGEGWYALADLYGATIELGTYQPSEAGTTEAGSELIGERGRYFWQINILSPTVIVIDAEAGFSEAGDVLGYWDSLPIECAIRRRNHAHLTPIFGYTED